MHKKRAVPISPISILSKSLWFAMSVQTRATKFGYGVFTVPFYDSGWCFSPFGWVWSSEAFAEPWSSFVPWEKLNSVHWRDRMSMETCTTRIWTISLVFFQWVELTDRKTSMGRVPGMELEIWFWPDLSFLVGLACEYVRWDPGWGISKVRFWVYSKWLCVTRSARRLWIWPRSTTPHWSVKVI